jgi:hypothetical protein
MLGILVFSECIGILVLAFFIKKIQNDLYCKVGDGFRVCLDVD